MAHSAADELEMLCQARFHLHFKIPDFEFDAPESEGLEWRLLTITQDITAVEDSNTLLKLPPELRLIIYEGILSSTRVSPSATTVQPSLLQTCRLVRYEALGVYFSPLDKIGQRARERREKIFKRLNYGVGWGLRVKVYIERSRIQRDDVLRLKREMREVSSGAGQGKETKGEHEDMGFSHSWLDAVVLGL